MNGRRSGCGVHRTARRWRRRSRFTIAAGRFARHEPCLWEINGTEGDPGRLRLTAGQAQIFELTVPWRQTVRQSSPEVLARGRRK